MTAMRVQRVRTCAMQAALPARRSRCASGLHTCASKHPEQAQPLQKAIKSLGKVTGAIALAAVLVRRNFLQKNPWRSADSALPAGAHQQVAQIWAADVSH